MDLWSTVPWNLWQTLLYVVDHPCSQPSSQGMLFSLNTSASCSTKFRKYNSTDTTGQSYEKGHFSSNKLQYQHHLGDIVISKSPKAPKEYICKRVVAMEGDCIINTEDNSIISIKRGHVWLEGDNKTNSIDSRSYGQVPYGLLRGRVFFVLWPFGRLGSLGLSAENKGM
ncbi:mitochondrial inner membrane protease subunit 1-like isoform X1 [Pomacea canaliculata]|uniref:mitochondrial inner membrane protease subunit 1-like isoform X1 n=1 Tax=Pomacea canaliculata TaxID=400727 RepID=UPI000D73DC1C|nr:mitochondrial inner membrane protease subunit 1-like isoform X1 [Pomacea canaliculata]